MNDSLLKIHDFNIFRKDQGKGGGVCIYARSDFNVKEITTNNSGDVGVEDLWIVVQHRKMPSFIVGAIYRHPHAPQDSFDYLQETFRYMSLKAKPLFILGDINEDLLNGNNRLYGIIRNNKLTQIIEQPTRITNTSATLIDVIITNSTDMILNSNVYPCEIADHELVSVQMTLAKPKRNPTYKTMRCMDQYSREIFCNYILNETSSLNSILNTDDIDIQVNTFTEILNKCIDNCAPIITKKITRPPAP